LGLPPGVKSATTRGRGVFFPLGTKGARPGHGAGGLGGTGGVNKRNR